MSLSPGSRLGPYEIVGSLGAGGPASARVRFTRELRRGLAEAKLGSWHRRRRTRPAGLPSSISQWMGWLKMDRMFDPLRSEPRFVALMRKLKLGP